MTAHQSMVAFHQEQQRRRSLGIGLGGRYCLVCGRPLYGPELLHSPPANASLLDQIRSASEAVES